LSCLNSYEIIISEPLIEQILRVAKRLRHKDWGGELLSHLWHDLHIHYVLVDEEEIEQMIQTKLIPR